MKLYTTVEIQEMTEVTENQLSEWIKVGVVEPFVGKSSSGGIPMFDLDNLMDINLSKKLSELRLPNHAISASLKQLHRFGLSKHRFGHCQNKDIKKSFWDQYLLTYENKKWFLVIINKKKSAETSRTGNIFLKAYNDIGVILPRDSKDIFLVFPVPKEKLLRVFEFAELAIVLKIDEIVDMIIDKFSPEELMYTQGFI